MLKKKLFFDGILLYWAIYRNIQIYKLLRIIIELNVSYSFRYSDRKYFIGVAILTWCGVIAEIPICTLYEHLVSWIFHTNHSFSINYQSQIYISTYYSHDIQNYTFTYFRGLMSILANMSTIIQHCTSVRYPETQKYVKCWWWPVWR